jgi:sensor histidine kinase regulating citrate/malate metabolism
VRLAIVDDGATLTIRVADRGPGVAEEHRAELSHRGFSTKAGHAGVGLALVRDAVAAAGGTLEISGSTFTATIPVP